MFRFAFSIPIAAAVGIYSAAWPSLAAEWSAKTSLSETLDISNNYFLSPAPKGILYASTSALFVDLTARTPTSRYTVNGDVAYIHYMGAGAADTSLTNIVQNGVNFTAEYAGHQPADKLSFVTSWRRADIATSQINDIGVATAQGETSTITVGGNFTKQLSAIDTLSFGATESIVEVTGTNARSYHNLGLGPTWTRNLNSTADWISSTDLSWTAQDDGSNSDTKFTRALTGFRLRPDPRLKVSGSVGIGIVSSSGAVPSFGAFGQPILGFGTNLQGQNGLFVGYLADGLATYQLRSTTDITVSASRAITPGVLGELSLRTTYGLGLSQRLNNTSSISLNGQLSKISGGSAGLASDFWIGSASYEKRLSKEWRTNFSYVYRQTVSSIRSISSNTFTVVLARDVTLLP